VVGVEAAPEFEFGEALSEPVARALPEAEQSVRDWLFRGNPEKSSRLPATY
jgi:Ni,Fe-hydrogenase maturation factor